MRSFLRAALAAVLFLSASSPIAARQPPDPLTADDAVREALAANADLQAARLAIDVARGGLLQAGRLPNPELAIAYADDFAFGAEGERLGSAGLAQRFPITARLAREKTVAREDVAIAAAEVRDFVRTLVADVQRSFYAVRIFDERSDVDRQLLESIGRVEQTTARRLEAAEVSSAELSLLRIERLRLEQDVKTLTRERDVAAATLARLLGRATSEGLVPVGVLDPGPLPPRLPADPEARPDLDAARRRIERADADRSLARAEVWQDWTLGLGYEIDRQVFDDPVGNQRDQFLTLGVTVPLPLWDRQQGRLAAAEAERQRARRSRAALLLRIEEQIRTAEVRVQTLRSSADAYEQEILPEAAHARALFERGYQQGLVGIAELLQAQRQDNESRALFVQLLGDLRLAVIGLEAATGTSPHLDGELGFGKQGDTP